MVTVNSATISQNIWKNFYDRLKSNVTSVSITGSSPTVSIQTYTAAYSDEMLDAKSNYPILIVNEPELPTDNLTFRDTNTSGTITIEVFTNQSESATKFKDKIRLAIEGYKSTFDSVGIHNVKITDEDSDMEERGKIKIHIRRVTFSFEHDYT